MSTERKRKHPKPHAAAGQAKRRKAQSAVEKQPINVNSLPWKTVQVPDMFDDAEGFYGLEEVEGVEVVRQGDKVQFLAAVPPGGDGDGDKDEDEHEEFSGFDDPPEVTAKPNGGKKAGKAAKPPQRPIDEEGDDEEQQQKVDKEDPADSSSAPQPRQDQDEDEDDSELQTDVFTKLKDADVEVDDAAEEVDMSMWASLDLSPRMLSAIARLKFSKPTAIQEKAIPEIAGGHDVIGKAATGSGKTLAFGIPIVERWLAQQNERARGKDGDETAGKKKTTPLALILSPTRELAHQITNHIKDLCAGLQTSPYVCSVTGGLSVQKQQRQLEKAEIVVGTPGRLWEVLNGSTSLLTLFQGVSFLVVDEADRLLTDGHFKEVEEILDALDRQETHEEEEEEDDDDDDDGEEEDEEEKEKEQKESSPRQKRQTLVFSATFNRALQQKLAGKSRYNLADEAQSMEYLLKKLKFREQQPKFLDVNPVSQMAEGLKEGLIECGAMEKDLYLYSVLLLQPTRRTLVFTNSISSVRRLAPLLQNLNLPALPLHSEMPQKARLRSIEKFTAPRPKNNGTTNTAASSILVATDVAARGLDIPGIDLVIHYHVPRAADTYVHRSGRTARAESSGISVMLCAPEEVVPTRRLVAKVHAVAGTAAEGAEGQGAKDTKKKNKNKTKIKTGTGGYFIQTIDIDRRLVSRLRERVVLAKRLADATLAKEKGRKEEDWMRAAAEELGVEYEGDGDEDGDGGGNSGGFEAAAGEWSGRGSGRKKREKEARGMTRAEAAALRAELRALLSQRVNTGVSQKYLSGLNVDELLRGEQGTFLGKVPSLGLDEL